MPVVRGGAAAAEVSRATTSNAVRVSALPLPDKPSIAVLPFANMSGDAEQEYFADGMVEDITTELSRFGGLFVIARNSSFQYKGKAIDVRQVGRELGVRYVLEGSVRRAEDRIRVAAQLVDAESGGHLWAEKYDHAYGDLFALQDRLTQSVVAAIEPEILIGEGRRAARKSPTNLGAFDCCMRGMWHSNQLGPQDNRQAESWLRHSIELDPPVSLGDRGHRYRVAFRGGVLIESCRVPGLDACRALLALGITGKLEMWRPRKAWPDLQLDIERAAKLTVIENEKEGPRFGWWRPFSDATQDAVSSGNVSPPTRASEFPALEPV